MAKIPSRKTVIKNLDDLIRKYLKETRPSYCVTCGYSTDWFHPQNNPDGLQVSHYVSRRFFSLRWDIKNVEPMCVRCNYNHNQNPAPFSLYMMETYGKERLEYLEEVRGNEKAHPRPIKTVELIELLEKLKQELFNGRS